MESRFLMIILLFVLLTYLIGSISSAVIVSKWMNLPDPRTAGSGNPGATNVLRVGGKKAGLLTLLGDALKGYLPVLLVSDADDTREEETEQEDV